MFRYERKFVVSPRSHFLITNSLGKTLSKDFHSDGAYNVRSIYFDDIKNSSYLDVILDAYDRRKYRIRVYNKSDKEIFLEEKRKKSNKIYKTREILTREEYDIILRGNVSKLKEKSELMKRFSAYYYMKVFRPKVIIEYDREAFVYPNSDLRLTLDKNIKVYSPKVGLFNESSDYYHIQKENPTVLEVKYHDYVPNLVHTVLNKIQALSTNFSKYALSIEKLYARSSWR